MPPRSDPAISPLVAHGLCKEFGGKVTLNGVSFETPRGCVTGLLGPNGAGKTTTLRILVDLIRADAGTVTLAPAAAPAAARDRLGYLPEERGLYKRTRVVDCLCYFAALKGVPREVAEPRARSLLQELGLAEQADVKCEQLSKGMQQKVQFAAALLHDPDVLLLDEPFSGLDPVSIRQVRQRIRVLRNLGKAILLSTHVMSEAQLLCDRVVMLHRGQVVLAGDTTEVRRRFADDSLWQVECDEPLPACPLAESVRNEPDTNSVLITLRSAATPAAFLRWLAETGVVVNRVERHLPSLEEVFLRAVGGCEGPAPDPVEGGAS